MAEAQIPMLALSDLRGKTFIIPSQQRGYKWTRSNVRELIADLKEFIASGNDKPMYCLQPLAIVPLDECGERYSVLDGQQRLTTLFLIHRHLFGREPFSMEYERDDDEDITLNRQVFLNGIDAASEDEADRCIDFHYIWSAYDEIKKNLKTADEQENFRRLLNAPATAKSVQVIWYEVAASKSHATFRNLNSGKMELSNTELIKALFLNRVSGLKGYLREEAAVLFENMEQQLREDRFWYMFNTEDVRQGQNRLDAVFNLVSGCSAENYATDPRWSFRNFFDHGKGRKNCMTLEEKWHEVRHVFLRLRDLYEDIYTYHYVGFLTYCRSRSASAQAILSLMRKKDRSGLLATIREQITDIIRHKKREDTFDYNNIEEYTYDSKSGPLRRLFVLYNIETVLSQYETLRSQKGLKYEFERFPFELLYSQKWDIEHIASRKEADFESTDERDIWLDSIKADLGDRYSLIGCGTEEKTYMTDKKRESFNALYRKIMAFCEKDYGDDAIPDPTPESDSDETGYCKNKNRIGNLTILDSHTNRSYRNALFPRKRRTVLVASGLPPTNDEEKKIEQLYVPVCTRMCFTKSYSRGNSVNLNLWGCRDAEAYTDDMHAKLDKYFKS